MGTTLAIVERSHRGTVEQQYAHVLWLIHALHLQSPMTVLLQGGAAAYALAAPPPEPLVVGGRPWGVFPDYRAALDRLRADGARVLVSATALARLGLTGLPLVPDVQIVTPDEIALLVAECDRTWFL